MASRTKRETRLIFRDKTMRMMPGGNLDEQTGQITFNATELGLMKKRVERTLPIMAMEVDLVSLLTSNQIRIDVPNYYANGQEVPITDRKEVLLRKRLVQLEANLKFKDMQLSSSHQALGAASINPEDMLDKRIDQLQKLTGVVAPIIRPVGKKGQQSYAPSILVPPENYMPPSNSGDMND